MTMERRDFLKLASVLPAAASVTLTAKDADGKVIVTADVAVFRLEPGDTVVLMTPGPLRPVDAANLRAQLADQFPQHKVLVVANGAQLGVIRGDV
jgi:hypothetical protein